MDALLTLVTLVALFALDALIALVTLLALDALLALVALVTLFALDALLTLVTLVTLLALDALLTLVALLTLFALDALVALVTLLALDALVALVALITLFALDALLALVALLTLDIGHKHPIVHELVDVAGCKIQIHIACVGGGGGNAVAGDPFVGLGIACTGNIQSNGIYGALQIGCGSGQYVGGLCNGRGIGIAKLIIALAALCAYRYRGAMAKQNAAAHPDGFSFAQNAADPIGVGVTGQVTEIVAIFN